MTRLVNVRLDEERVRKARTLRERGVTLSDLVRQAIDERYEGLVARVSPREIRATVARILEDFPEAPGSSPRQYDVHDARAARRAIRRRVRRTGR